MAGLGRVVRVGITAVVVAVMAATTAVRVSDWRSDESLWRAEISVDPQSIRGHMNLGHELDRKDDLQGAAKHALIVVELSKDPLLNPWLASYAWSGGLTNFSHVAIKAGDLSQASRALSLVIEKNPEFGYAHYNLGLVALARGDCAAADKSFETAFKLDPSLIPWPPCHSTSSGSQ